MNFKKVGVIEPKKSTEIKNSKIGLGFEKLDRGVFDPEKAYDKVCECGVKYARIQSGWQRTEKDRGVYDFAWLDDVINNLCSRGIEPWICLCYGNALYTKAAETVYGAVGCPPIFTDEEKAAWQNYVKAVAKRYLGKVKYFEVWNEPDGPWCWKHGPNAKELGEFTIATAKAIKEVRPDALIIGGAICMRSLAFLNSALKTGMANYIDYVSFHEYVTDENKVFEKAESFRALAKAYNPKIEIIQGESGSPSRGDGHGALWCGAWTEEIQAKQLARHTIADLLTDVHFTSYFSCMDMIEALNGKVDDKASYLDYGYFGVLRAEFDENGKSTGEYSPKPSYYVLQNICSVFEDDCKICSLPVIMNEEYSYKVFDMLPTRGELTTGAFEREGGKAFVYWKPTNIMTTSYESQINIQFYSEYNKFKLVDIMDGGVYEIPQNIIEDKGDGVYEIKGLPVKDTPLILVLGDFLI